MHDGGWGLWVIHSTNEIEKSLGNHRQVGENDVSWFTLSRALPEYLGAFIQTLSPIDLSFPIQESRDGYSVQSGGLEPRMIGTCCQLGSLSGERGSKAALIPRD